MSKDQAEVVTRVSSTGKLSLPAQHRRLLGLEKGGPVMVWVENGEVRIRTMRSLIEQAQSEAQALFAGTGESVERFLEDRRAEAHREESAL